MFYIFMSCRVLTEVSALRGFPIPGVSVTERPRRSLVIFTDVKSETVMWDFLVPFSDFGSHLNLIYKKVSRTKAFIDWFWTSWEPDKTFELGKQIVASIKIHLKR